MKTRDIRCEVCRRGPNDGVPVYRVEGTQRWCCKAHAKLVLPEVLALVRVIAGRT